MTAALAYGRCTQGAPGAGMAAPQQRRQSGGDGVCAQKARGRKAARRATFPYINSQIVSVADTGNLAALVSTIEAFLPDMNLVNISTAMHRLAKLSVSGPRPQHGGGGANRARPLATWGRQTEVIRSLAVAARAALAKSEAGRAPPQCQALSNITWSMATMQCADSELMDIAVRLSLRHLPNFKPFELSAALWAFAKLDSVEPGTSRDAAPLFQAAAQHVSANAETFSFRCLVMIVWAFAAAGYHEESLFRILGKCMLHTMPTAQSQELASVAWSYGCAGVRDDRLLAELARRSVRVLNDFKPQEFTNSMWAFARLGFLWEDHFVAAARTVQGTTLKPSQLAVVLWAFGRLRPRHPATKGALMALLPRCSGVIDELKPQELAGVALAAAKCFGRATADEQPKALPTQVAEFFRAATPWVVRHAQYFSGRSLANLATAYAALGLGCASPEDALGALGHQAALRASVLEPAALLLFLRNLPAAPRSICCQSVCRLFHEAAVRINSGTDAFSAAEREELAMVCVKHVGMPSCSHTLQWTETLKVCITLSKEGAWPYSYSGAGAPLSMACFSIEDADIGQCADPERPAASAPPAAATSPVSQGGASPSGGVVFDYAEFAAYRTPTAIPMVAYSGAMSAPQMLPCTGFPTSPTHSMGTASFPTSPSAAAGYAYSGVEAGSRVVATSPTAASGDDVASRVRYSVKNTFLEVDDDAEEERARDGLSKPLPPPLDIIPSCIAPERLEDFRTSYQKFRAGDAAGARGEISMVAALDLAEGMPPSDDTWPTLMEDDPCEQPSRLTRGTAGNHSGSGSSTISAVSSEAGLSGKVGSLSSFGRTSPSLRSFNDGAALPPPLEFLPKVVDVAKLACYRQNYQRFRAGAATGAHGEIGRAAAAFMAEAAFWSARVGPPLNIVPSSIPEDKLAEYRMRYQSFRAGGACGAKGEVFQLVGGEAEPPSADVAAMSAASCSPRPTPPEDGPSPFSFLVKNTFVHISTDDEEEDGDAPSKPLPPSLPCIPHTVSPEHLRQYRADYQRFRAGCATGAKGEVSMLAALDLQQAHNSRGME